MIVEEIVLLLEDTLEWYKGNIRILKPYGIDNPYSDTLNNLMYDSYYGNGFRYPNDYDYKLCETLQNCSKCPIMCYLNDSYEGQVKMAFQCHSTNFIAIRLLKQRIDYIEDVITFIRGLDSKTEWTTELNNKAIRSTKDNTDISKELIETRSKEISDQHPMSERSIAIRKNEIHRNLPREARKFIHLREIDDSIQERTYYTGRKTK